MNSDNREWWHTATIYQIYPKSFCDSKNLGTGDLKGIISKLDYIRELGVDAIWLTPVYVSPQVDNGYDIADYYNIDPSFGTMQDFDMLLFEAHRRGIQIVMDIVVNHTSTEHAWFKSALGNKKSPYRDYYIWKDPVDGKVPNNWQSKFGGSAWEKDEQTGQYYLHLFAKEQADLNWENPQVREEVKKIIQFWVEKGVDGFRLDVINLISKDQAFPNDKSGDGRRFYTDGPRVHEYLQEISSDVFQKYGVVTVGEMSSTSIEHCRRYSAVDGSELSMVFNFHHLKVDYPNGEKWTLAPFNFITLKKLFSEWQKGLHNQGWNALFWCNHDQPRIVSRFGDDGDYREHSAKMLATAVHMLQGTPYIYQGEEIGMTNPHYSDISQYRDVESLNMYNHMLAKGMDKQDVLAILASKSRDNSRTPMQWDDTEHAGFTKGVPWLHPGDNYKDINVKKAISDQNSVFYFYRDLIDLRKRLPVVTEGDFTDLAPDHPSIFCYRRTYGKEHLLVVCNFYADNVEFVIPDTPAGQAEKVLGNYTGDEGIDGQIHLRPYECRVYYVS
ncbi:alpha,alpha-phosphotrehalase [Parasalinivibrio latis]|uniref:alpha,alpha-phosphotrehalase n=1 Tax=Parasalinivibrio latis TaxID=2952610 RepID=UPI0030E16BCB